MNSSRFLQTHLWHTEISLSRMCRYSHSKALLTSRILETRLSERQRSFASFSRVHYSLQISASVALPTVQGWEGLLCNRCLILGSLSNVLSKLLKVGLLSASNAQHTVKVSWKKKRKIRETFKSWRNMKCLAWRECASEEKDIQTIWVPIPVGNLTTVLQRDLWTT